MIRRPLRSRQSCSCRSHAELVIQAALEPSASDAVVSDEAKQRRSVAHARVEAARGGIAEQHRPKARVLLLRR